MEKPQAYKKLLILSLATVGGIGYVSFLEGTVASLAAALVFLFLKDQFAYFSVALAFLLLAFLVSGQAERIFNKKDARQIVIDDFAGMLLTFLFAPHTLKVAALGFLFFRIFDGLKVYPANFFEKQNGSLGVVGDDLVAGVYAAFFLNLFLFLKALV